MPVYPELSGKTTKVVVPAKQLTMTEAGPSADSRGGSSRSYPKSKSLPATTNDWNPHQVPATKKYVGGVD